MYDKIAQTEYDDLALRVVNAEGAFIGSGSLKKGSVLASRGVSVAAVKAKKSVTFTGTPVASKTITVKVCGKTVTYTTSSTTLATEVSGIASAINADSAASAIVTASASTGKLNVEFDTAGYAGNSELTIEVTVGDGAGVTAGAVAVEVIGQDVGQEIFELVDSDSGTEALRVPVAVLLEDAEGGEFKLAAFAGDFNKDKLLFAEGDSLNNFKAAMRKIGIFAIACAE